jgi:hypothetical protein
LHSEFNTFLTVLKLPRERVSGLLGIKPLSTNKSIKVPPKLQFLGKKALIFQFPNKPAKKHPASSSLFAWFMIFAVKNSPPLSRLG